MKNPFDPFGVFGEWKGQQPDEEMSWEESTIQGILSEHRDPIDGIIGDAAWDGIHAERKRVLELLRKELKSMEDLGRVIKLIEGD